MKHNADNARQANQLAQSASTVAVQGGEVVGEAITQMDHTTQQNAALVEEMAAAASSLKSQAQDLVATVGIFRLVGDGGTQAGASRLPPLAAKPLLGLQRSLA